MNKQNIITVILAIGGTGVILSTFGMIISSGIAPDTYSSWWNLFLIFIIINSLGLIFYSREQKKNDQSSLE